MAQRPDPSTAGEGVSAEERRALVPDLLARRFASDPRSYARIVWDDFRKNRPAHVAMWVMVTMVLLGVGAPMIANHRPYLMNIPQAAILAAEGTALAPGWQSPMLSLLRLSDWLLLLGLVQAATAIVVFRRSRRRRGAAGPVGVTMVLLLGALPIVAALTRSPVLHSQALSWVAGWHVVLDRPQWLLWTLGGLAVVGALLLLRSVVNLYLQRRDEFGRPMTGTQLSWAMLGSLLVLIPAAWLGTLGQRQIDNTDYFEVAQREGVKAWFAPVQHDFLFSNSHNANEPPLSPTVRVQATGGSQAASDLGLSDDRRHADIAAEVVDGAKLTPGTPLASLRHGQGMRRNDAGTADFTVISHSMARFAVSLHDARTVGEALLAMNTACRGVVTVSISPDGSRLLLSDSSLRRPIHFMGTDANGSDVAARLIHATRVALSIGFVSTGIALFIGVIVGALMGYFGGWVDIAGMRTIEIFMAIPRLFLLLTIIAFIPPQWNEYMLYAMMAVIGATGWMGSARFIRAEFMRLRHQDFVQAAQAVGLPTSSVLFRHMLPNGVTPVLVDASFGVAAAIFVETGLSFLGFGIKPPNPSWGKMLSEAVDPSTGVFYWWLAIFPGIMIFLTVFAFNLIGDALRDAIDPKLKKAAA